MLLQEAHSTHLTLLLLSQNLPLVEKLLLNTTQHTLLSEAVVSSVLFTQFQA